VGRVLAGSAQHATQIDDARTVKLQLFDGGPTCRRQPMNEEKIMRPSEVIGPLVLTRMKQRRRATSKCVDRFDVNEFRVVAPLTRKREV
jgi:hypothetical protein